MVYAIATYTETKHNWRLITAQDFMHDQAKDSYCRQRHLQLNYCDRRLLKSQMEFWRQQHRSIGSTESHSDVFTTTPSEALPLCNIIGTLGWKRYVWLDVKKILLAVHFQQSLEACERLWRMRPKQAVWELTTSVTTTSGKRPIDILSRWASWNHSQVGTRPLAHTDIDCSSGELTRALPTSKTTVLHNASMFMDNWAIRYGITIHVLTSYGAQSISKFSETPWAFLGTRYLTITPYHLQPSDKLSASTSWYMQDYDITCQSIIEIVTYSCSCWHTDIMPRCQYGQIQRHLVLFYHFTPGLTTFENPTALPTDETAKTFLHTLKARLLRHAVKIRQYADKQIKSTQQCYINNHDQKVCNAPFSFTVGQYVYLNHAPMTRNAAEHLPTELYNSLTPPKTGQFMVVKLFQRNIKIHEERIRNTVSIDQATLATLSRMVEWQNEYRPNEPVYKRGDEIDEGEGQTTAEALVNAPREYAVDCSLCRSGDGEIIGYVVRQISYTTADDTIKPFEPRLEHLNIGCWRRLRKNNTVDEHKPTGEGRYWSSCCLLESSNVEDEISNNLQSLAKK